MGQDYQPQQNQLTQTTSKNSKQGDASNQTLNNLTKSKIIPIAIILFSILEAIAILLIAYGGIIAFGLAGSSKGFEQFVLTSILPREIIILATIVLAIIWLMRKTNDSKQIFIVLGTITIFLIASIISFMPSDSTTSSAVSNELRSNKTSTVNNKQPMPQITATTSKTVSTLNWKTYTNNKYSFSFRYPSVWTYADSSDLGLGEKSETRNSGYGILLGDPTKVVSAGNGKTMIAGSINLHIYNKNNYAFYSNNISDYYKNPISTRSATIYGLNLLEVHHTACPTNNDCISVLFKNGENVFAFDTSIWTERIKDLEIIYQILSTFKSTQ